MNNQTRSRIKSAVPLMVVAVLSFVLAGCGSIGPQTPQRYFVLEAPAAPATAATTPRAATLLIAPTTVSGFYEAQDIVYSRTPGTRAYYQLHAWTERPGPRLTELLVAHLDRAGLYRSVATVASGLRSDAVLRTHLSEFYHDATSAPGSVNVTIAAELTVPAHRDFLVRRTFTRTAPVATYDAPGAVQAFNRVMPGMLDEIAAWVEATAPR